MAYDTQGRAELNNRSVVMDDICDFFKNFMLNDRLGQIDNLHLAHADSNSKGVKSTGCMKLAVWVRDYYCVFLTFFTLFFFFDKG